MTITNAFTSQHAGRFPRRRQRALRPVGLVIRVDVDDAITAGGSTNRRPVNRCASPHMISDGCSSPMRFSTAYLPHIAQIIAGTDINVTMGYKAVYPDEAIQSHLAFLGPPP